MDEKEEIAERVRILKELIDSSGGIAHFCRKYSRDDAETSISPTYVSQLKNGSRSFGVKAARKMEENSTLPKYYFDPWRKHELPQDETDGFILKTLGKATLDDFSMAEMLRVNEFLKLTPEQQQKAIQSSREDKTGRSKESGEGN